MTSWVVEREHITEDVIELKTIKQCVIVILEMFNMIVPPLYTV